MLYQHFGFKLECKQSTIPLAGGFHSFLIRNHVCLHDLGNGVFLRGRVAKGTVVCLYPGMYCHTRASNYHRH
jgi:hypothetical protein